MAFTLGLGVNPNDPLARSASDGEAIAARFVPKVVAKAFRSSVDETGITATTRRSESSLATSVLNTCAGSTPKACATSTP